MLKLKVNEQKKICDIRLSLERRDVLFRSGFTIIEVLIVLAIAGLILLIVFLAVPALQRNSRNTQYRSDASKLLGAAQELINNKGGTLPVAADNTDILNNANSKNITSLNITNPGTVAPVTPT